MIKNVVFDIGGVLLDIFFSEKFESICKDLTYRRRLIDATVNGPIWKEFDRGILPYKDVVEGMISIDPEIEDIIRLFMSDFKGALQKKSYADDWIRSYKSKGYNVYYLSNFPSKVLKDVWIEMDFIPLFDGGMFSYQEKLIKPEKAFYELFLKRYNLNANECVFTDDNKENIDGAIACGMHGIVFDSVHEVDTFIKNLT